MIRKLANRVDNKLRRRYSSINVTKPYVIKLQKDKRFSDKIVVITGGSGAIGRAISCMFASEGAVVYVCGTTQSKIESVVSEIEALGGIAYPCVLDVTNEHNIINNFKKIIDTQQRIDILVTSAGGSSREKNSELKDQETNVIDNVLNVNLRGTILCAREAAKQMTEQKNGKIVTLSSTIGLAGKKKFSEYAAAKAGVINFVKSLAMELGHLGINVNCVSPGIVQRNVISGAQLEQIKKTNYLNDYCTPEDIAHSVLFMASEEARFITGVNLVVDGGRSLGLKD